MENDMEAKRILAIVGPTASGKTALSLLLARRLNAEIISADSRQVYRRLDIGTAKPTPGERSSIVHHFIDIRDPGEEYNAGEYGKEARAVLSDIVARGKVPLIVGGSGLYVRAFVDGFFEGPGQDPELRTRLEREYGEGGITGLLRTLEKVDPISAQAMAQEPKPRRIMRALEVYYTTGKPLSAHFAEQKRDSLENLFMVAPLWPRKELYSNIERRVDRMMEEGLMEEVRSLKKDYVSGINALKTVGYSELYDHLDGQSSLEDAVRLIKQNTRRFAKRQMTWFRRDERIQWIPVSSREGIEEMGEQVLSMMKK